jgi:hypothetical protein
MIYLRINCTEIGMNVEASQDLVTWESVQFSRYTERKSTSVMQYKTFIDPQRDEREYLDTLRQRGIVFKVVRAE